MTLPPSTPSYDVSEPVSAPPAVVGSAQTSSDAAGEWFERNGRALGVAAIAVVVAVGGGFAWRASNRASADRAERALYEAESRFAGGDPGAVQALQQVTVRYGDTPAGSHARVLLAQALYDEGKFADGLRALGTGGAPGEWQRVTEQLRAVGEQGAGRPKEAAGTLERLATGAGPDERASLLGDAARAYTAAGDIASARRVWQTVIDGPARAAADEARVRLGELEATGR